MGHYDDITEAREAAEFKARADKLGITTYELLEIEKHNYKMGLGDKYYHEQKSKQDLIDYYLKHR